MAQTLNKNLPGNPSAKARMTFSDTALTDAAQVLVASHLLHGLLSMTPTANRAVTFPSAVDLVNSRTQFTDADIGDAIPFVVRNQAAIGSGFDIILTPSVGITGDSEANLTIVPGTSNKYILRIDDAAPGIVVGPPAAAPACTVFQVNSSVANAGPAFLNAEATTIGAATTIAAAGTAQAFENLVFTVGAGVAPAQGITLTGLVSGSTTFTVANAGIYRIHASVSGNITVTANALVFINAAIGGVANAQNLCALGNDTAATDPHGDCAGEIILAVPAAGVLSLFVDTDQNGTIITADQVTISIVRVA